jgi:hypothetical protein
VIYTATINAPEGWPLILASTEDGGAPTFKATPAADNGYTLLGDLDRAYDFGLYGTGPAGEVRDMVAAMVQVSEKHRLTLEVPPETQAKVDAEAEAWDAEMAPGGPGEGWKVP